MSNERSFWNWDKLVLLGAVMVGISACQSNKEKAGPPLLNGSWASSDGVYVAELRNGDFKAVANDTGGVISQGRYIAISEEKVKLEWYGVVSGKSNSAQCLKPSTEQLDCVDENGNKFSLRRTSQN